jgi:hypothetical protein
VIGPAAVSTAYRRSVALNAEQGDRNGAQPGRYERRSLRISAHPFRHYNDESAIAETANTK